VQDVEWIKALPIHEMVEDDTALFLWATQEMIHTGQARAVAVAWGFPKRVGEIVWRKPNYGTGAFPRAGHETCLLYGRSNGSFSGTPRDVHSVQTWSQVCGQNNGGKVHSAKPDGFYDLVERSLPGPYLELFARRARFGWSYWGDQSLGTAEMDVA
jgi:N6-adenosine-specific RNA methylase IME4